MNSTGENIKKIREERKLTQNEFSERTGISRSYLGDLENNRKNPSIETLRNISEKIGVSLMYLITGRKSLNDLTIEETTEQLNEAINKQKNKRSEFAQSVKQINPDDLTFAQETFLRNSIYFSSHYSTVNNEEYLKKFAFMFRDLKFMYDVYEDEGLSLEEKEEAFKNYVNDLNEEKEKLNFEKIAEYFTNDIKNN